MISKELLSEVLKEDFSSNKIEFEQADGVDSSRIVIDNWLTINIYELEHRCIEWAFNEGYACLVGVDICYVMRLEGFNIDYFTQLSKDFSNVFKACQWILDNKN